jgi:hypothetical protein
LNLNWAIAEQYGKNEIALLLNLKEEIASVLREWAIASA